MKAIHFWANVIKEYTLRALLDLTTPRPKLSRTHNTQRIILYSISLTLQNKRKFQRLYNLLS